MKIRDIRPDTKNANKGTAKGQKLIVSSIQHNGFGRSGLLDKDNNVIAGNKTTEAAAEVFGVDVEPIIIETDGKRPVYVKRTDLDLSDPDPNNPARQLAYMDNLSQHFSFALDPAVLQADIEAGLNLEAMDLSLPDLSGLLEAAALDLLGGNGGGRDTEPQIDRAEELRIKWGVEVGQLWQLGQHRLICGDCTDKAVVDRVMGGEKASIEIHDPPYGIRLDTDWSAAKSRLDLAAKKGIFGGKKYKNIEGDFVDYDPSFLFNRELPKELFLWGADYYAEKIPNRNDGSWLIWDKRIDEQGDKMYGSCFETCWSLKKHKRDFVRVKWIGVFGTEKEPDKKRTHPTQKPVLVYEWILSHYSKENDISGDFYLGVGSHLIACENLNRRCRAIEIDPGYCAVTLERFQAHTGQTPVKVTD